MVKSSIRKGFFLSATRSAKTRSHTPDRAQHMNRLCTLLYLPQRTGRSSRRMPERTAHSMKLMKHRLPSAGRPTATARLGHRTSIRLYYNSLNSCPKASICPLQQIKSSRVSEYVDTPYSLRFLGYHKCNCITERPLGALFE
jgi:hypothetical protein